MKCSDCGSDQHRRKTCPEEATGSTTETSAPRLSTNYVYSAAVRHTKNHFAKTIMLNGTPMYGIVDTGSTSVLIRDSVARRAYRHVTCPLYSVGDVNQPSTSTIGEAEVDVSIDGVLTADHQVRIVRDDTIPVDAVVGQSWLQLPHVHYYKCGAEMFSSLTQRWKRRYNWCRTRR